MAVRPHRIFAPLDNAFVERILVEMFTVSVVVQAQRIGFVPGKQKLGNVALPEVKVSESWVVSKDRIAVDPADVATQRVAPPYPGVAEPERRQKMQERILRAAIADRGADQQIVYARLCVLDKNVEVAVSIKDSGVDQFVLPIELAPPAVLSDKIVIRVRGLRILVQAFGIRVRRRGVEVVVVLLHILGVVALVAGETEEALLENRILAVPERKREAQPLVIVAETGDAVLAPSIRLRPGMIVRQVLPSGSVRAVVFAHRAPGALGQIGSPTPPMGLAPRRRFEAFPFFGHTAMVAAGVSLRYDRGSMRPGGRNWLVRAHAAWSSCRCNEAHSVTSPIARGGNWTERIAKLSRATLTSCSAYSARKCGGT